MTDTTTTTTDPRMAGTFASEHSRIVAPVVIGRGKLARTTSARVRMAGAVSGDAATLAPILAEMGDHAARGREAVERAAIGTGAPALTDRTPAPLHSGTFVTYRNGAPVQVWSTVGAREARGTDATARAWELLATTVGTYWTARTLSAISWAASDAGVKHARTPGRVYGEHGRDLDDVLSLARERAARVLADVLARTDVLPGAPTLAPGDTSGAPVWLVYVPREGACGECESCQARGIGQSSWRVQGCEAPVTALDALTVGRVMARALKVEARSAMEARSKTVHVYATAPEDLTAHFDAPTDQDEDAPVDAVAAWVGEGRTAAYLRAMLAACASNSVPLVADANGKMTEEARDILAATFGLNATRRGREEATRRILAMREDDQRAALAERFNG
jgi:hypothetical protein